MKKTLIIMVSFLIALIFITGCALDRKSINNSSKIDERITTIYGTPVSVAESYGQYGGTLAIVLKIDGKLVLAYATNGHTVTYAKAAALVLAEISDENNEPVELTGRYINDEFVMKSIKVRGYKIKF